MNMSRTIARSRFVPLLTCVMLATALAPCASGDQGAPVGFVRSVAADGAERLSIEVPVGQLVVEGAEIDDVSVEVSIDCSDGLFESACARRARRLELDVDRRGERLRMRLKGFRVLSGMGLEVRVLVRVPRGLDVDAELGLGELEVRELDGAVRADLGIGEVDVHDITGPVTVDSGIGEVKVVMKESDVASVYIDLGIGESSLRRPDGRQVKAGVLGSETGWTSGLGGSRVRVDLGIGEASVVLH
jgi:hypothetical protein